MSSPPPAPASRGLRLVNASLLVLLVLLLGVSLLSLTSYLRHPEEYTFGTEAGGWLYRSARHYLGGLMAEALVLVGGIVLSLLERNPARVLITRLLTLLLEGVLLVAAAVSL